VIGSVAIQFDELIVGSRVEKETKLYVFDGIYLVEKLPEQKVFVRVRSCRRGSRSIRSRLARARCDSDRSAKERDSVPVQRELLAPDSGLDSMEAKDAKEARSSWLARSSCG